MLNRLLKPKQRHGTGAITPNQTKEAEIKNYRIEELVAAYANVNYSQTNIDRWKIYPRRDQGASNTCVAQTIAKMAGIMREQKTGEFVEYSATPIYQDRVNKPQAGMIGTDALDQWRKKGVTLEYMVPSQNIADYQVEAQQINEYEKQIGEISRIDAYVVLPARDFDLAVSTMLATGKPLMVWHQWEYDEWDINIPAIKSTKQVGRDMFTGHHSTTLTPNVGIYDGKIGATTEDSWGARGINNLGIRWLTKEFYNARNTFTAYATSFKTYQEMGIDPAKPKYTFTRLLKYGLRLDKDVVALQNILKYEGLFPANYDSTGNFLEVTRKAVVAWQGKYGLVADGVVGTNTRKKLNQLYGQ